jgi:hypothetical protein
MLVVFLFALLDVSNLGFVYLFLQQRSSTDILSGTLISIAALAVVRRSVFYQLSARDGLINSNKMDVNWIHWQSCSLCCNFW